MRRLWSVFLCLFGALLTLALSWMALGMAKTAVSQAAPQIPPHAATLAAWQQVNTNGFGIPDNFAISALEPFQGLLYAGTWHQTGAGQLWRATDGSDWTPVTITWTVSNSAVLDLAVFGEQLYVGTSSSGGAELWRTDGSAWEQVVAGGFTDDRNHDFGQLASFEGHLYVATTNISGTHQLWRSPSGDAGDWTQVAELGGVGVLDVCAGQLYLGKSGAAGAELWRSPTGITWTSVFTGGLAPHNTDLSAMAEFDGQCYIGLRNTTTGGEVWRSENGLEWTAVITGGLGNPANARPYGLLATPEHLYLVFSNFETGAEVWRMTPDGVWTVSAQNGWGDGANTYADYFDKGAAVFQEALYIGTMNNAGGEIWRLSLLPDPPVIGAVSPATGPNDRDTPITITGQNFVEGATADLGNTPLQAVTWVSATQITGTVPWGMPAAVYTLTVTNPDSQTVSLPRAFTVTPGINVWTHGGPYGGIIADIVLNPVTPTTLYAAALGSGIFISDDGAEQWRPSVIGPGLERPAVDPHNPQWLYSGSHNTCLRSRDGGRTWDESCTPGNLPTGQYPFRFRLAVHPAIAGRVFLGTSVPNGPANVGHLHHSSDGGTSWLDLTSQLPQVDTNITAIAFDPVNAQRIIVGTRDGYIYLSTNGGSAWTLAARPDAHIERLVVNPFGAHEVWAITNGTDWGSSQVWRSANAALTEWTPVIFGGVEGISSVTFHPLLAGTIYAAVGSGFVSTDGGLHWGPVGAGLAGVLDFAIDPVNPAVIYAATRRGVSKSTDAGLTWAPMDTGLAGVLPDMGLATSTANPDEVFAASSGRVFRSFNGGKAWEELEVPVFWGPATHMRLLAVDPTQPGRIYLGGSGTLEVHLSEDHGDSWLTASLPQPTWTAEELSIWNVVPHPAIPGRILAGGGRWPGMLGALYLSQNHGESWNLINTGPISGVMALAYDPADPQIVYAGTVGGMLRSADSGSTWQPLTSWSRDQSVQAIAVHPANHKVFASSMGARQAIFVSADGGATWSQLAEQPTSGPVWELLYSQDTAPILYAGGMEAGLHYSTDEGHSWNRVPGMPGAADVPSLASVVTDKRVVLYVGTSGGAVTAETMSAMSGVQALLGSGIYRQTRVLLTSQIYLPLVLQRR